VSKLGTALNAPTLAELRQKPAMEIYRALADRPNPIVDGWVLTRDVDSIFEQGRQNDVPLLVGSNADERTPYGRPGEWERYALEVKARFGSPADTYLALYPAVTNEQVRLANNASIRDSWFGWQVWKWARAHQATSKSPVYLYWFDRTPPIPDRDFLEWPRPARFGAFHTSEIIYAMNNLGTRDWAWQGVDRRLAETMSSYWVNFARSGDPNGAGLPPWPIFGTEAESVMHLGEQIAAGDAMHQPALAVLIHHSSAFSGRREMSCSMGAGRRGVPNDADPGSIFHDWKVAGRARRGGCAASLTDPLRRNVRQAV
jgi:para-nitrobenzyl esterase